MSLMSWKETEVYFSKLSLSNSEVTVMLQQLNAAETTNKQTNKAYIDRTEFIVQDKIKPSEHIDTMNQYERDFKCLPMNNALSFFFTHPSHWRKIEIKGELIYSAKVK